MRIYEETDVYGDAKLPDNHYPELVAGSKEESDRMERMRVGAIARLAIRDEKEDGRAKQ